MKAVGGQVTMSGGAVESCNLIGRSCSRKKRDALPARPPRKCYSSSIHLQTHAFDTSSPMSTDYRSYRRSYRHIVDIAIAVSRALIQHLPIATSASNERRELSSELTSKPSEAHSSGSITRPWIPPARHAWPDNTRRPPPLLRGSARENTKDTYR